MADDMKELEVGIADNVICWFCSHETSQECYVKRVDCIGLKHATRSLLDLPFRGATIREHLEKIAKGVYVELDEDQSMPETAWEGLQKVRNGYYAETTFWSQEVYNAGFRRVRRE